jgi:hypothetical protein
MPLKKIKKAVKKTAAGKAVTARDKQNAAIKKLLNKK